jgi:EAL domain-containing protein (putative c-di-GMP-specific phosphodiesterase class I)
MVSINLAARDIESKETVLMILNRLRNLKHPENFIFEIVESDEFQDFDTLMAFIKDVRQFGVKIAIDDFGAGFSNLIEIAKIAPDYIKIDGEITRNFLSDDCYKSIMLTVCYLASRLNVDLIAEYVENMDIQKKIQELNIAFTQGYCYSPPIPYEQIDDFCCQFNS